MPVHHALLDLLQSDLDGAEISNDTKDFRCRSLVGRAGKLTDNRMFQSDA